MPHDNPAAPLLQLRDEAMRPGGLGRAGARAALARGRAEDEQREPPGLDRARGGGQAAAIIAELGRHAAERGLLGARGTRQEGKAQAEGGEAQASHQSAPVNGATAAGRRGLRRLRSFS